MTQDGIAESGHTIAWKIKGDRIVGKVTCHESEGAPCRMVCGYKDCDADGVCEHKQAPYDGCVWVDWFTNDGSVADFHDEDLEESLRDGPIHIWWDGHPVWSYLEDSQR